MKTLELAKHRTNIIEVLRWSNATPIRSCGDLGYKCCYCEEQYREPADLKKHTLDTHPENKENILFRRLCRDNYFIKVDITGLQCKICKENFNTIEDILPHLKTFHKKTIYNDLKNHIIAFKFDTETLQCFICANKFSKFKMLQEHMHIHYRNYICDVCDVGYFNHYSLKYHKLTHKTGSFTCEFCPKVFDTKVKRKMHEKTKHVSKPITFKCGYCQETFSDFWKKESHLVSLHGLKVPISKCQACDKVFPDRNKLRAHVKRVHLMQKPHNCSQCDMSFCSTSELRNHMTRHSGQKSFKCTVCLKAYARAKTLREHMKIHDDVRRFKCEHCGQAFVQKCSWRGHMKSKHGEIV